MAAGDEIKDAALRYAKWSDLHSEMHRQTIISIASGDVIGAVGGLAEYVSSGEGRLSLIADVMSDMAIRMTFIALSLLEAQKRLDGQPVSAEEAMRINLLRVACKRMLDPPDR